MSEPLQIRAFDAESLHVLSACLQDAIVPICDVAYLPDEKRFVLVANRFKWEDCSDECLSGNGNGEAYFERTLCGVCFEGVRRVKTLNLDLRRREQILSLLALDYHDECVELHFCGGSAIRLEVECVRCRADDMGESWPTVNRPRHPIEDAAEVQMAS